MSKNFWSKTDTYILQFLWRNDTCNLVPLPSSNFFSRSHIRPFLKNMALFTGAHLSNAFRNKDRWHPFLFIILPKRPERFFSKQELAALEGNQKKLVTISDLHFLLKKFAVTEHKEGKGKQIFTVSHMSYQSV